MSVSGGRESLFRQLHCVFCQEPLILGVGKQNVSHNKYFVSKKVFVGAAASVTHLFGDPLQELCSS